MRAAVDMLDLVGGSHAAQAIGHPLRRPLPVPRGAHGLVLGRPGQQALPLLRLPARRRPHRVRARDAEPRLRRRRRMARRALRRDPGVRGQLAGGGSAPGRAEAPAAAAGRGGDVTTRGTCGRRPRPAPFATYLRERGIEEATARSFRLGYSPTAWDRLCTAAGGQGLQRRGARPSRAGREGAARAGRPVPRPADVPARRRARPGAGIRRPAAARRRAAQVQELAGGPGIPQERDRVRPRPGPRRRSRAPARRSWWRGTPTCWRCIRWGSRTPSRPWARR